MTLMTLTGNYGFYPLLTLTLCLSLIDDSWLNSWTGSGLTYKGWCQVLSASHSFSAAFLYRARNCRHEAVSHLLVSMNSLSLIICVLRATDPLRESYCCRRRSRDFSSAGALHSCQKNLMTFLVIVLLHLIHVLDLACLLQLPTP